MKTVVRTANLKLDLTPYQHLLLSTKYDLAVERAAEILRAFFCLRGETVDLRSRVNLHSHDYTITPTHFHPDMVMRKLGAVELARQLYDLIIKQSHARALRSPFLNVTSQVGEKSDGELEQLLRKLVRSKLLPLYLTPWNADCGYDYAAFQMAHEALKSWADRDAVTRDSYQQQHALVIATQPSDDACVTVTNWLERHKLSLTRRVLKKFSRFRWTTRLCNYPFEELRCINDDAGHWLAVFEWVVESQRLADLRPTAAHTLPHPALSPRAMPLGANYNPFTLSLEDNRLVITVDRQRMKTLPSRYYRGLAISAKQGNNIEYELIYERGNNSPLPENVCAGLKEVRIFKKWHNGRDTYYLSIPANVHVPELDERAKVLINSCFQDKARVKWPAGVIVTGLDLGIIDPGACVVTETVAVGKYKVHEQFIVGAVCDVAYYNKLKGFRQVIRQRHKEIDSLQQTVKDLTPFTREWISACQKMAEKIASVRKRMNQLRRFDLVPRGRGVSAEALEFIILYKKYIGLLQRWTDFGTNPAKKGERRLKFQEHYRRLSKMKLDFRKKFACEVIRELRKRHSTVLVIENLEHFLPDQENKTNQNELLMLWGHGQIGRWLQHFAEQYGIAVIKVDPRCTSQTDALTGHFGRRDKFNTRNLYVDRNNAIVCLHANLNAAENIAKRFHFRGLDMPCLYARRFDGGFSLYWPAHGSIAETKKSQQRIVKSMFNSLNACVNSEGEIIKLPNNVSLDGKPIKLYKHGKLWLTEQKHRIALDTLAARAGIIKPKKEGETAVTR